MFRSTQTLVGLMCWLAEKKTRSPFRRGIGEVGEAPEPEQVGGAVERPGVAGVEPPVGEHLLGDRPEGGIREPARIERAWHRMSLAGSHLLSLN